MSTDTDPQATMMAKIAAMETELAGLRKTDKAPGVDPRTIAREIAANPSAAMAKYNIDKDYVTKVLVAEALGDKAPQELRNLVAIGPHVAAQSELAAEMAALRQRLDASDKESARRTTLESTKTLAADKKKYPHLAAAYAADPGLIEDEVGRTGANAAEAATQVEARLARAAKALGAPPSVSQEDTDSTSTAADGTSTTTGQKVTTHAGGNPPPLPQKTSKSGFSDDDKVALRDEVVRNFERGVYNNPSHPYRPS